MAPARTARQSWPTRREPRPRFGLDVPVQAVPAGVHRHDGREVADAEVPHGFGRAELHERHTIGLLDAARVELRGTADGIEVDGSVLLERGERPGAPSALADDHADAVALDDVGLVRLFADARRGACRGHLPPP